MNILSVNRGVLISFVFVASCVRAADVTSYHVVKRQVFTQTSANPPVISTDAPFRFEVGVYSGTANVVSSVTLVLPNNQFLTLVADSSREEWRFKQSFTLASLLDATYSSGSYLFSITTVHDGSKMPSLLLSAGQYPAAPQVLNYAAAQAVSAAADFTVNWTSFSGGSVTDFIDFWIEDNTGNAVFKSPSPGNPSALNGLATAITIPRSTLAAGRNYTMHLSFWKMGSINTTAYPGATGLVGIGTETTCNLTTASGTVPGTPDVTFYFVGKIQSYVQTSTSAPVLNDQAPFGFNSFAKVTSPGSVSSVTGQRPNDPNAMNFDWDAESLEFRNDADYSTKAELDLVFPSGSYIMTVNAIHDGARNITLYLPPDAYPNPPQISNLSAAQSVNASADFSLGWLPFQGGTANDYIQVQVRDAQDNKVYESPFVGKTGALNGTSTAVVIPPGTLNPGATYYAQVLFAKALVSDTTSYPGVLGIAGYVSLTVFSLTTGGNPTGTPDVSMVYLSKDTAWIQTSSAPPVAEANDTFGFSVGIIPTTPTTVNSASLVIPGGASKTLSWSSGSQQFRFRDYSPSKATLDGQYLSGNYLMNVNTVHDGTRTVSLNLPADVYPNPPQVINFDAAQAVNPGADFVLNWQPFIGGTVNDLIVLSIGDYVNGTVFRTPILDGSLNGTASSCLIPRNTLAPNRQYSATLNFYKITSRDTTSYPGVTCLVAYGAYVDFTMQTGSGNSTGTPDVSFYVLQKTRNYNQTSEAAPTTSGHCKIGAWVKPSAADAISSASIKFPNGFTQPLSWSGQVEFWGWEDSADSEVILEAQYPSGNYILTINTVHEGTKSLTLYLPPSNYPAPARISNLAAAQAINPSTDFTLSWDPFTGGTVTDFINMEVYDSQNHLVLFTAQVGAGHLDSTTLSYAIPANTLSSLQNYTADLYFLKTSTFDTNTYPGAMGIVGFMADTEFNLAATSVTTTPDVVFYGVYKGRVFVQTSDTAPILGADNPYFGGAVVIPTSPNSVTGASMQLPNGFSKPLPWYAPSDMYLLNDYYADPASLDVLYGTGNYTLTLNTVHDGTKTLVLNMPANQYPAPARVSNFPAAQTVNAQADFVVTWDSVAGATEEDRIAFYLYDSQRNLVFHTRNHLAGTSTSVVIPAGTLVAGNGYRGMLFFVKVAAVGNNQYPGVASDSSFYVRTDFSIVTTVPAAPRITLIQRLSDGSRRLQVSGVAGRNVRLEATTDFHGWSSLGTMNVPSDPANFFDGETPGPPSRFYRAVLLP